MEIITPSLLSTSGLLSLCLGDDSRPGVDSTLGVINSTIILLSSQYLYTIVWSGPVRVGVTDNRALRGLGAKNLAQQDPTSSVMHFNSHIAQLIENCTYTTSNCEKINYQSIIALHEIGDMSVMI